MELETETESGAHSSEQEQRTSQEHESPAQRYTDWAEDLLNINAQRTRPAAISESESAGFGVGVESTASTNALSLHLGLLFFSLPEVPALVNVLLVAPLWSAIIFVIWFVIKESMPFV